MTALKKSEATERAIRREQLNRDFSWLMNDPRGRRLMMRLLSDIGMYRCTFDPGLKEVQSEMLFREGQKNVGYKLIAKINEVCPETYFLMLKEDNDGRRSDRAAKRGSNDPGD